MLKKFVGRCCGRGVHQHNHDGCRHFRIIRVIHNNIYDKIRYLQIRSYFYPRKYFSN